MLGRLFHVGNSPISQSCVEPCAPQKKVNLEEELKLGVEYVFQFHKKLENLSWEARNIIESWLQNGKQF